MILGANAMGGGRPVEVITGGTWPAWCNRCMTSSAVRIRFYVLGPDGPLPAGLWWACQACDPDRFGGDEDGDEDGDALASR